MFMQISAGFSGSSFRPAPLFICLFQPGAVSDPAAGLREARDGRKLSFTVAIFIPLCKQMR